MLSTQECELSADNYVMVNSVSSSSTLASMATGMQNTNVQAEISMAIIKQMQKQQQVFANAMLEMIREGPMPDGTGQIINTGV